jgi:hypothetical protein
VVFYQAQINKIRRQMLSIIRKYYISNRTVVNDDTDKLAEDIRRVLDYRILVIPSGLVCLN